MSGTGMKTSNDILATELLDLKEEIILVEPSDTPLVTMLYSGGRVVKASDLTVTWRERKRNSTASELKLEGAEAGTPLKSSRQMYSNVCQILERNLSVSGTMEALHPYGVGDAYSTELADRIAEIKKDLEFYFLTGAKNLGTDSVPRQMNGLYNMFANVLDKTGKGALTLADFEDCMQMMWDKGCNTDVYLFVNATEKRALNKMLQENGITVNATMTDEKLKIQISEIETDFGKVKLVLDRHIPQGTCMGIDLSQVEVSELRSLFHETLAKTGDYTKGHILVENTIKLLNQYAGFKIIGIGSPAPSRKK